MQYAKLGSFAWSFRREIGIVFGMMAMFVLLPIFATLGIMNNGVQAASDTLVGVNPVTHKVEVKDASGNVVKTFDASTVWPAKGTVTQEFGHPNLPFEKAHTGIDIGNVKGTSITTALEGTVVATGAVNAACGLCVHVDHGDGITSGYYHLSEVSVSKGQRVKPGDVIGKMGDTGWAVGSHLHFMVWVYRIPVNPRMFMVGNP